MHLPIAAVFTFLVAGTYGDVIKSWPTLDALPKSNYVGQGQAILNLACRLLPNHCKQVTIEVNDTSSSSAGTETYQVSGGGAQPLHIKASSGVTAAWALHRYLRDECNASISWDGDQLNLPDILPVASFSGSSPHRFHYYQNVCTFGYSFAWWDWKRWERELDWMALNGINLALAYIGQEAIWNQVFRNLGLSKSDIDHHFSGPAFLPWNRMGNMRGWGGPLTDAWHHSTVILQRRILGRMRELGIIPILPGFSGIVPKAFKRVFPKADTVPLERWNNFADEYCCPLFLQPTDPNFQKVGTEYLKELIGVFGTNHLYGADPFNEMRPEHSGQEYLSNVSKAIFRSMERVDPKAIWVLQGWMFTHDSSYWTQNHIKSFLTAVPTGRILVLDLQAELTPVYKETNSFYGQPFVWCMLHNFGGTLGLYGAASLTNEGLFEVQQFKNNSMVGTGITPEGTGQNYVMYDLMLQLGWENQPLNLTKWFTQYHTRRYGLYDEYADKAWQLLKKSVYNNTNSAYRSHGRSVISTLPELGMTEPIWYDQSDVLDAWANIQKASKNLYNSTLYIHDLVDITRQVSQLVGAETHRQIVESYVRKDITSLTQTSDTMLRLLDLLEKILASGKNFLLGNWLEAAKSLGTNELEKQMYEFNARNQITLWGPKGEIRDYANKQWSGVVSHYFRPRWALFTKELQKSLTENSTFNQKEFNRKVFERVEEPFTLDRTSFPTEPKGDAVEISRDLLFYLRSANNFTCRKNGDQ